MVTIENWTHCVYKQDKSTAQITLGAEPDAQNKIKNIFFLSQFDKDHQEEYQIELNSIEEAVEVINKRYAKWSFVDLEVKPKKKSSGCDSCQAH